MTCDYIECKTKCFNNPLKLVAFPTLRALSIQPVRHLKLSCRGWQATHDRSRGREEDELLKRTEECESDLTSFLIVGGWKGTAYNTFMEKKEMAVIVIVLMGLHVLIAVVIAFEGIFVSLLRFPPIDLKLRKALLDSFLFHLNFCHWGTPLTLL